MSRNSGGTYSLPAGNPVVSGTTITIAWGNGTLSDIATALTDSLSRSGQGGMTAALGLDAGLLAAPGLTFTAETTLGLYRASAGVLGVAVGGTQIANFSSSGLSATTIATSSLFKLANGTAAAPSLTFTSDTDTGVYRAAANQLGFAAAGVVSMTVTSAAIVPALPVLGVAGTAALPGFGFTGDADTGMSAETGNTLVLSTGGTARQTLTSTYALFAPPIRAADGSEAAPSYTFGTDTNTGFYSVAANSLGATANGSLVATFNETDLSVEVPILGPIGSESAPTYSFAHEPTTGVFSPDGDEMYFSELGTGYKIGFRNVPQLIKNTSYTLSQYDAGEHIYKASGGSGETITIPAALDSNGAFALGDVVTIINQGGGTLTLALAALVTMELATVGPCTTITIADNGIATIIKVGSNAWFVSGAGLTGVP